MLINNGVVECVLWKKYIFPLFFKEIPWEIKASLSQNEIKIAFPIVKYLIHKSLQTILFLLKLDSPKVKTKT